jgi:hypothetical protein
MQNGFSFWFLVINSYVVPAIVVPNPVFPPTGAFRTGTHCALSTDPEQRWPVNALA